MSEAVLNCETQAFMSSQRTCMTLPMLSQRITTLALTTRNVSMEKENLVHVILSHFASRLDDLALLLEEMQTDAEVRGTDCSNLQKAELEAEVEAMERFLEGYVGKCHLYLLISCPQILKQVQVSSKNTSNILDSVSLTVGSGPLMSKVLETKEAFDSRLPKLEAKKQTLIDSLEMLDSIADPQRNAKLVVQIAETLGTTVESQEFAEQLDMLKMEKESVELSKGKAYTLYVDQFVGLLEKAIAEKSKPAKVSGVAPSPLKREFTLRNGPLLPLQSFICPITRDVMRDPVQIASGQTYERSAIERWFADGHTRCPMGVELKNTKMIANLALRQGIAEWRERAYDVTLDMAGDNLQSGDLEKQLKAVQEIKNLCEEDNMNKYTIRTKGILVPLVHMAESKDFELRKRTFATLKILAQENDENQEIMVAEGIIDLVLRYLARRLDDDDSFPALLLLRLLSEKPSVAEKISHAHGAVMTLVTCLGSKQEQMVDNVKQTLDNLPSSDENIVIMAEANLMKRLVSRLISGETGSKVVMAKTLAHLHMPDTSKIEAASEASIITLMNMVESPSDEVRESAIGALENLTTVPEVCRLVAVARGPEVLLTFITSPKLSPKIKIGAARIIGNVMANLDDKFGSEEDDRLKVETFIDTFLPVISPLTLPAVQAHVLRGLLGIAKGPNTGRQVKEKMKGAFSLLTPLLNLGVEAEARRYALQLYCCLSGTFSVEACVALKQQDGSLMSLVQILRTGSNAFEPDLVASATILADLPEDDSSITSALLQADIIPLLVKLLGSKNGVIVEAAAGALLRFTSSSSTELQCKVAELGVVQKYVTLLDSPRNLTKERAGRALGNFSKSSQNLSRPVESKNWLTCCSPTIETCRIHLGICKVESNFCLIEAEAVHPLLAVLKEGQVGPSEAAVAALLTLVSDDLKAWEAGCKLIANSKGIPVILTVLSHGTPAAQEAAIILCEKLFRLPENRHQYGAVAQMHIITVAQRGGSQARHIAGKILRELELLHSQSNYFVQSS